MLHAVAQELWQNNFPRPESLLLPFAQAIDWLRLHYKNEEILISVVNENAWININWRRPICEAIGSIMYTEMIGRKGIFLDGVRPGHEIIAPGWRNQNTIFGNRMYYVI